MNEYELDCSIKAIYQATNVNIYGAGLMGCSLMKCITEEPYCKKVSFFVVKSLKDNPNKVVDIPVIEIEHANELKGELLLVALHEKHLTGVIQELREAGFKKIIPVSFDGDIWTSIRKHWMDANLISNRIRVEDFYHYTDKKLSVYVAHSKFDKKLAENFEKKSYEIPIMVGAALSDVCDYPVRDDTGDNISKKNRQYCELTALYWIWKNDRSDYAGICHYRRRFLLSENDAKILVNSDIDVVVTTPMINFNTVRRQYEIDHDIIDWDIMMEAIDKLYPSYRETAELIQNGEFYYAYNMFISKKKFLDDYCKWLFDILDYCEKKITIKYSKYQERFAGFLAERLLTIYLAHNQKYKVVVAPKHFIESEED